jgi:hypothetical protein
VPKLAYRKIDKNRFVKIYPYVRFPPRYAFEFDTFPGDSTVEAGKITFTDAESGSYAFTGTYATVPAVTISTVNSAATNNTNVSVTVSSITLAQVTVTASAPFTGEVHVHVASV